MFEDSQHIRKQIDILAFGVIILFLLALLGTWMILDTRSALFGTVITSPDNTTTTCASGVAMPEQLVKAETSAFISELEVGQAIYVSADAVAVLPKTRRCFVRKRAYGYFEPLGFSSKFKVTKISDVAVSVEVPALEDGDRPFELAEEEPEFYEDSEHYFPVVSLRVAPAEIKISQYEPQPSSADEDNDNPLRQPKPDEVVAE